MKPAASSARSISTPSSSPGPASISTQAPSPSRAPTMRCARPCWTREARQSRRHRPPSPAAAPIPAWCPGSSSRRCVNVARDRRHRVRGAEPTPGANGPALMRGRRRQGHPHRRARHPALAQARSRSTSSSTPGRSKASSRRAAAGRARLGHARELDARPCPHARHRLGRGDLPARSPAPTHASAPGARRPARNYGFLVTHNEAISIADYFTVREASEVVYRPTCHYAYHPSQRRRCCRCTSCSAAPASASRTHSTSSPRTRSSPVATSSACCSTGHANNAYWYGSRLTDRRRPGDLAPYQNATGMQVTSAVHRRHGLGARASDRRHRRGRRDGLSLLPRGAAALSRRRSRASIPTGRRSPTVPASSRRTSTLTDPWQFRNVLVHGLG